MHYLRKYFFVIALVFAIVLVIISYNTKSSQADTIATNLSDSTNLINSTKSSNTHKTSHKKSNSLSETIDFDESQVILNSVASTAGLPDELRDFYLEWALEDLEAVLGHLSSLDKEGQKLVVLRCLIDEKLDFTQVLDAAKEQLSLNNITFFRIDAVTKFAPIQVSLALDIVDDMSAGSARTLVVKKLFGKLSSDPIKALQLSRNLDFKEEIDVAVYELAPRLQVDDLVLLEKMIERGELQLEPSSVLVDRGAKLIIEKYPEDTVEDLLSAWNSSPLSDVSKDELYFESVIALHDSSRFLKGVRLGSISVEPTDRKRLKLVRLATARLASKDFSKAVEEVQQIANREVRSQAIVSGYKSLNRNNHSAAEAWKASFSGSEDLFTQ